MDLDSLDRQLGEMDRRIDRLLIQVRKAIHEMSAHCDILEHPENYRLICPLGMFPATVNRVLGLRIIEGPLCPKGRCFIVHKDYMPTQD